jgi:hypothetical protein
MDLVSNVSEFSMSFHDDYIIRGDIELIQGALDRREELVNGVRLKLGSINAGQFLAAGASSYFTSGLYNPLDCLKVRWQMVPSSHSLYSEGIISFASHIIRTEGLFQGLWRPGLVGSSIGMGLTSSIRFGSYERVRDIITDGSNSNKSGVHMLMAGLICGSGAYFITTPFHLLKTKLQAEKSLSGHQTMTGIALTRIRDHGFWSLWKGSIPISLRGACFTAGQMYGKCMTIIFF